MDIIRLSRVPRGGRRGAEDAGGTAAAGFDEHGIDAHDFWNMKAMMAMTKGVNGNDD